MLPAASITIGHLLAGPFIFNIPPYQRPFSWTEDQAGQLVEDLMEAAGLGPVADKQEGYFLGTILLMDTAGNKTARLSAKMSPTVFDVVDGQQRLVTLLTMAAVLRDSETAPQKPLGRRVQSMITARQGSRFFFSERPRLLIAGRDQTFFENVILKPASAQTGVLDAELAPAHAALLSVKETFAALFSALPEKARAELFDFVMQRCHAVVVVANDIDSALKMFIVLNERGKKLQRNDILKADVLSRIAPARLKWAEQVWDEASSELGDGFEAFFGHLRTIYNRTQPQIVAGVRAVIADTGGAENFLQSALLPLSKAYGIVRRGNGLTLPAGVTRHLVYLNRFAEGDWAPAAMLALKDFGKNAEACAANFAEIDRLAHLTRLLCMGNGKRVRRFQPVVEALRNGDILAPGHPAVQFSREEIRNIAFHLKDLHKRNPKACKLLLLRLNDEIEGTVNPIDPGFYTVEHVLPQRQAPSSEWRRWFPAAEERSRMVENLGNLVLVTKAQNEKARNASLKVKQDVFSASDPDAPVLTITKDIFGLDIWRPWDVLAREERLLRMIEKLWRVDAGLNRVPGAVQAGEGEESRLLAN